MLAATLSALVRFQIQKSDADLERMVFLQNHQPQHFFFFFPTNSHGWLKDAVLRTWVYWILLKFESAARAASSTACCCWRQAMLLEARRKAVLLTGRDARANSWHSGARPLPAGRACLSAAARRIRAGARPPPSLVRMLFCHRAVCRDGCEPMKTTIFLAVSDFLVITQKSLW